MRPQSRALTQGLPRVDGGRRQRPGGRGLDEAQRGVGRDVGDVGCSSLRHWNDEEEEDDEEDEEQEEGGGR